MKSKVESRSICRARSERKIAAPLSTPTRITDCPAKSLVICAPSSLTRVAISCREISTLSSVMAFHIKLRNVACTTAFRPGASMPGFLCELRETLALSAVRLLLPPSPQRKAAKHAEKRCSDCLEHRQMRIYIYESQRPQTHVVRTCDFPYRDPGRKDCHYSSLGHEQS